jgi:hypothetical protein
MTEIQRSVLDILKPHEPEITDFTEQLAEIEGIEGGFKLVSHRGR